ncbi:unnamed protein product, partial [Symbiodinium sp. CCMP2592]
MMGQSLHMRILLFSLSMPHVEQTSSATVMCSRTCRESSSFFCCPLPRRPGAGWQQHNPEDPGKLLAARLQLDRRKDDRLPQHLRRYGIHRRWHRSQCRSWMVFQTSCVAIAHGCRGRL